MHQIEKEDIIDAEEGISMTKIALRGRKRTTDSK
jgi:hypothetical protein